MAGPTQSDPPRLLDYADSRGQGSGLLGWARKHWCRLAALLVSAVAVALALVMPYFSLTTRHFYRAFCSAHSEVCFRKVYGIPLSKRTISDAGPSYSLAPELSSAPPPHNHLWVPGNVTYDERSVWEGLSKRHSSSAEWGRLQLQQATLDLLLDRSSAYQQLSDQRKWQAYCDLLTGKPSADATDILESCRDADLARECRGGVADPEWQKVLKGFGGQQAKTPAEHGAERESGKKVGE